jgi:hypothetical protein
VDIYRKLVSLYQRFRKLSNKKINNFDSGFGRAPMRLSPPCFDCGAMRLPGQQHVPLLYGIVVREAQGEPVGRQGLVAMLLKGRKSRPWAKPRVGKTKRPDAHASWIEAEILFCGHVRKKD